MNIPINNHPLAGTTHTFRPDQPPYDAAADTEGGTLILGNGMTVTVRTVFANWNGVAGLDMLYVHVHETGHTTHVTPADLGLPSVHSYLVTEEVKPEPEPTTFTVTATLTYDYDSRDGIVTTRDEAKDDMWDVLSGGVSPDDFTVTVTDDAEPSSQPVIIVKGNPVDGFTFEGPFSSREAAIEYGDSVDTEWWVADLDAPEEDAPEEDGSWFRICATCDKKVPDDDTHPSEWQCSNGDCGIWFHVGGSDHCPACGAEGSL